MQEFEIELAIGETLRIGDHLFTVVEVDGQEVCVRLDDADDFAFLSTAAPPAK